MRGSFLMLIGVMGNINVGDIGGVICDEGPGWVGEVGDTCWEMEGGKVGDVGDPFWDTESLGTRGEWRGFWALEDTRVSILLLTAKKWLRRMTKLNSGRGQHENS